MPSWCAAIDVTVPVSGRRRLKGIDAHSSLTLTASDTTTQLQSERARIAALLIDLLTAP